MPIRKAKEKDIKNIHQIINKSNRDAYSEIIPEESFKDPILTIEEIKELFKKLEFYIYIENGKKEGVAGLNIDPDKTGKIRWVHILPQYRRKGIGTELMNKIEKEAEKKGLEKLFVKNVHKKAKWARKFYSDLGYKKLREVNHSQGECLIYEKNI